LSRPQLPSIRLENLTHLLSKIGRKRDLACLQFSRSIQICAEVQAHLISFEDFAHFLPGGGDAVIPRRMLHGRLCLDQCGYEKIQLGRVDVADGDDTQIRSGSGVEVEA
jgi:hypothetical protein